jgi:hypothetical protein
LSRGCLSQYILLNNVLAAQFGSWQWWSNLFAPMRKIVFHTNFKNSVRRDLQNDVVLDYEVWLIENHIAKECIRSSLLLY